MGGLGNNKTEMSKWDKLQLFSGWGCLAVILFCLFGWEYVFSSSWCSIPWTIVMVLACIGYVVFTAVFDYHERKRVHNDMSGFLSGTIIKSIVLAIVCAILIILCVQMQKREAQAAASGSASGSASGAAIVSEVAAQDIPDIVTE